MSQRRFSKRLDFEPLNQRILLTTLPLLSPPPISEPTEEITVSRPEGLNLDDLNRGPTLSQQAVESIISEFASGVEQGHGPLGMMPQQSDSSENDLLPGEDPDEEPLTPVTEAETNGTSSTSENESSLGEDPSSIIKSGPRRTGGGVWIFSGGEDLAADNPGFTEDDLLDENAGPSPLPLKFDDGGRVVGGILKTDSADYYIDITYHPNGQAATATVRRVDHENSDDYNDDETDDADEKPDGRVEWNSSGQRIASIGDVEYVDAFTRSLPTPYPVD